MGVNSEILALLRWAPSSLSPGFWKCGTTFHVSLPSLVAEITAGLPWDARQPPMAPGSAAANSQRDPVTKYFSEARCREVLWRLHAKAKEFRQKVSDIAPHSCCQKGLTNADIKPLKWKQLVPLRKLDFRCSWLLGMIQWSRVVDRVAEQNFSAPQ